MRVQSSSGRPQGRPSKDHGPSPASPRGEEDRLAVAGERFVNSASRTFINQRNGRAEPKWTAGNYQTGLAILITHDNNLAGSIYD